VGNVPSAIDVTLTFNVRAQIFVNLTKRNKTLEESGDLSVYCDATGSPTPTVQWTKVGDYVSLESKWLNRPNINGDESGDYICSANNTCGKVSSNVTTIDVQ